MGACAGGRMCRLDWTRLIGPLGGRGGAGRPPTSTLARDMVGLRAIDSKSPSDSPHRAVQGDLGYTCALRLGGLLTTPVVLGRDSLTVPAAGGHNCRDGETR